MSGPESLQEGPRLPPVYRLVSLQSVDSTNQEARRRAEAGAEDGTLISAESQTAGRGRSGRDWTSPAGNLYISLVLRPDCALAEAAQLGFVAALAVKDGIAAAAPPLAEVKFKWPNDILINSRKSCGILLESKTLPSGELDWLVLGIGVNVQSYPEDTAYVASSLRAEGWPPDLTVTAVLESISRHFLTWTNRWLDDGFGPVRQGWRGHAEGIGEEITVRLPKETLTGTFVDLDETGALLLRLADGSERQITAGDVYFGE